MRTYLLLPLASAVALVLAGCAATPENPQLLDARQQFSDLQNNPKSSTLAPIETKDAFTALSKADVLSNSDRKAAGLDQLAYLATQKIALAQQTIAGREASAGLANIDVERTQVQLDVRTQQLKALQALDAKPSDRGQVITFGDVLFDTGKSDLKSGARRDTQQLAGFLENNLERKVRIEGFTDTVGSETSNQKLSERRADAVAFALIQQGVDPARIITHGYGEEYPVAGNDTASARQLNRRVEVIVSNGSTAVQAR
ncbi:MULTISPECIES: OmpA family protein [unclassified Pseudomonas]|uniref:OmpA family protein n=1 Tax=unclassified Pseudomonas TaxID=196821 RepID=UPI0015A41581|nr:MULTISPECIES: OmpA family protein [unclassified Pseudomonas]NWC94844.1 OmpA family protein [Pseudomonas sp. IPO3779]NWD15916.1 OmpA family protein [Pseudomonas sp. IPO3778]